jgi:hypothetical protein
MTLLATFSIAKLRMLPALSNYLLSIYNFNNFNNHKKTNLILHTQWAPACGTAGKFWSTICANKMSTLTLQDWWKHIIKTNWAFEEAGQVRGAAQCGYG